MITKVKVSNFKSFDQLEVELRPLNIVVGSNAAGKSNFLEIFRFIRDWVAEGPENAVSLQGGMEYLTNLKSRHSQQFSLEMTLEVPSRYATIINSGEPFDLLTYRIELEPKSGGQGFKIVSETSSPNIEKYRVRFLLGRLLGIELFDLDPRLPKKATPVSGRAQLESDGSNLALVLRKLLQDRQRRAAFVRILRDALPFIEDLSVDRFADKSLLVAVKEQFFERSLPASFLSDGTIHLIALILALYFHEADVTIIEEPERNIHPHLISKVARMLADASRKKQVIVTTHNPELVKHADLADLLLVTRDEKGFSHVTRPAESAELKVFLENDLGVDELYVQNLLGVGHGI